MVEHIQKTLNPKSSRRRRHHETNVAIFATSSSGNVLTPGNIRALQQLQETLEHLPEYTSQLCVQPYDVRLGC